MCIRDSFYLSLFWSEALAGQEADREIAARFSPLFRGLKDKEHEILEELANSQGSPVDLGGYYLPDEEKTSSAMRPSKIFNSLLSKMH